MAYHLSMRALFVIVALGLALLLAGCDDDDAAQPAPPGGITWVEFPPSPSPAVAGSGVVVDVRIEPGQAGGHPDAIVFEFKAGSAGGWVEYVDKADVISCGPGDVVPLRGEAALKVHFEGAGQHEDYVPTGAPGELTGSGAILEAKRICDFEAVLEWAIGTSGVTNFTVTTADDPKRVVIRVAR
jgi:hypothetical protein